MGKKCLIIGKGPSMNLVKDIEFDDNEKKVSFEEDSKEERKDNTTTTNFSNPTTFIKGQPFSNLTQESEYIKANFF